MFEKYAIDNIISLYLNIIITFYLFQNPGEIQASGLIFSGNKFACKPTLPFNAFAMPSYDSINIPEATVRQGHLSEQVYKKNTNYRKITNQFYYKECA